jgi:hypothetical protein
VICSQVGAFVNVNDFIGRESRERLAKPAQNGQIVAPDVPARPAGRVKTSLSVNVS